MNQFHLRTDVLRLSALVDVDFSRLSKYFWSFRCPSPFSSRSCAYLLQTNFSFSRQAPWAFSISWMNFTCSCSLFSRESLKEASKCPDCPVILSIPT